MLQTENTDLASLAKMRERFLACEEAESRNRERAVEALRFYFGEQWADEIQRQRTQDGRPCFTLNKLPAIVKQVLNESRQNRPAIEISPVSDGADEETAETIQGLARHVEVNSDAEVAYESAFEYMVVGGFGSWRILTEYLPKSVDQQEIFIKRLPNPFSVYWDPDSVELDKSDASYAFITKDYSRDVFTAAFPDSELSGFTDFSGLGDQAPGWLHSDGCRVVEYFYIENEEKELVQLQDGSVAWEDEIPKGAQIAAQGGKPVSRKATRKTAYSCKSNGVEWLEKPQPLPTDDIPIVTIYADQVVVDGEMRVKGMVADAMEAQRMFNYNSSAIAETMALGTKANWLVTPKQMENFGAQWSQANSRNQAFLPFNPDPSAPPPQKISTEPPIQAMSAARLQSADDLRSITGVYDATQAPNGGEESGKAILARRHQASTGNLNFTGNLARGIKRTAKILLKYFPVIYDTPRIMRIVGADMQPKQVMVHAGQPQNVPPQVPDGIKGVFDLTVGTYDVAVSVGPSFETKRQEATNMLLTLVQAEPQLAPIIGDLIVNQMDFSGKQAIVDRLQKALPPQLQDQKNPTDPGQLQAHNSMLMQQNQALMQQVQKITQMLETKQIEAQGRLQVEQVKQQSQQIRSAAELEQARIKAQSDILVHGADKHLEVVHDHAMASKNHIHAVMMAERQASLAPEPEPAGKK